MTAVAETDDILVAVTAREDSPLAELCEPFGRAYWLLVYSSATNQWKAIDNRINRARKCGSGIATAEVLIGIGVTVVLTGETGPKAFRTLTSAGVSIVHNVTGTVEDALSDWRGGQLQLASLANDIGSPICLLGRYQEQFKTGIR